MSIQVDLGKRLELRDDTGRLLGYYVPAAEYQTTFPNAHANSQHGSGVEGWEQTCKDLTEERDRLRAEVDQLRAERDQYLKSLYALTRQSFSFTKDEILKTANRQPGLDQVIAELEETTRK